MRLLIGIILALPAWGTGAFVTGQFASAFSATSPVSASLPSTPTIGNYIIAACAKHGTTGGYSASDNQATGGNTYTVDSSGGTVEWMWTVSAPITKASGTFTVSCASSTFTNGAIEIVVAEFSGIQTTPADVAAYASGTSTGTHTSGSTATTAQANEVIVSGALILCGSCTITAGSGFTKIATIQHAAQNFTLALQWKVVSATGTYTGTFTDSQGFGDWTAGVQTYKSTGASASMVPRKTVVVR